MVTRDAQDCLLSTRLSNTPHSPPSFPSTLVSKHSPSNTSHARELMLLVILEILPIPSAISTSVSASILSSAEQRRAEELLGQFDTPSKLEQALNQTRELIAQANLPPFRFKDNFISEVSPAPAPEQAASSHDSPPTPIQLNLGSFATMALRQTPISFRYPTPISPNGDSSSRKHSHLTPTSTSTPAQRNTLAHLKNFEAPVQNVHLRASVNGASQPHNSTPANFKQSSPQSGTGTPGIQISIQNRAPTHYHNQVFDEAIVQSQTSTPSKAKSKHVDPSGLRELGKDQQEEGDNAFAVLQDLMQSIFEAEDQLEPDTSGAISTTTQQYFQSVDSVGGIGFLLQSSVQNRLYNAISKAISVRRFDAVPTDYLIRLQRLSHRAFLVAGDSRFAMPPDLNETASSELEAQYAIAENALRAARTVMKIMMGGRDDKQLYSEEILQDLLALLRHVFTSGIVPAVEARPSGKSQEDIASGVDFESFSRHETLPASLTSLLRRAGSTLNLCGDLLMQVELSEEAVGTIESLSVQLLFVENAATEKDSVVGISRFEDARRRSMDVLAKVFLRFPEHRKSILTDILSSLEKLPVGRQSARQFKVVSGKPIQVTSALIMLLVQISATHMSIFDKDSGTSRNRGNDGGDDESFDSPSQDLVRIAKPLIDEAQETGRTVIRFILSRALRVSKSSDEPYRNLLDIFTEDFVNVLGHPEWPASELLLRLLLNMLLSIAASDKTSAPEKSMALELMGSLGSGIAELHSYVVRCSKTVESGQGSLDTCLRRLANEFVEEGNVDWTLEENQTLCRAVAHYLPLRDDTSLQIRSAQSFLLTYATDNLLSATTPLDGASAHDFEGQKSIFAELLKSTILNPVLCVSESPFANVSTHQGLLAYALYALSTPFCRGLRLVFDAFIRSLKSSHATVKSRALKSVIQLLEKNEQIVHTSNGVIVTALRAADDSSPSVRDSALTLLGKCLSIKPSLDAKAYQTLLDASSDKSVAVRKKSIKLLKEIYQRNQDRQLRDAIAEAIIRCATDPETSVSELAKSTIEDMWMALFYGAVADTELGAASKRQVRLHSWHIVGTVQLRPDSLTVLETLLDDLLNKSSRKLASNRAVAKAIIVQLFDGFVDNVSDTGSPSQSASLRTLKIFAAACPKLFDADQMRMLGPYLLNMETEEDKSIYRSVVSIYCCVLPVLPRLEQKFLADVTDVLRKSLPKLATAELREVAQCLWIMNGVLNDTARLATLTRSIVSGILNATGKSLGDEDKTDLRNKTQRYIMIAGPVGKFWDLTGQEELFRKVFPKMKKDQRIPELMVDALIPFFDQRQPRPVRVQALESVGMICQSWPENFAKPQVVAAFEDVFKSKDVRMESSILEGILEFYKAEEVRSKSGADIAVGEGSATGAQRLGKSLTVSDHDGAATSLAQRFLAHILRICLASYDSSAWVAVQTIASINRQGLVHPKECAPALVAMETSPNQLIAKTAAAEHLDLHQKHESMLGKEYVHAIEAAFKYQRDTVKQESGVKDDATPKLKPFFEVLKTGTSATRKKLYTDITRRLDFNAARSMTGLEERIPYTSFVVENFALVDFTRTDDALHLHACLERIFIDTGNLLSQLLEPALETMQQSREATVDGEPSLSSAITPQLAIPRDEFKSLTVGSIILSILWEARTYLKRTWALPSLGKQKLMAKDASKAPVKSSVSAPEAFIAKLAQLREISLDDDFAMMTQCRNFLQALSTDNEHKVVVSDDDAGTPGADNDGAAVGENGIAVPGSGKGRKRRRVSMDRDSPTKAQRKRGRPLGSGNKKKAEKRRKSHASDDSDVSGDEDYA